MKLVGLLSGTSADGVDAALLEVMGAPPRPACRLLAYRETPFPPEARARILHAASGEARTRELTLLRRDLGRWFGEAARGLLAAAGVPADEVAAVGCHGQTVWHEPPCDPASATGTSLQLVDAALVAAVAGVPVVSDFRAADLAAGGQGAPLVPFADRLLFARPGRALAILNLGGVGNVTWLPPDGDGPDPLAFDTGPGNALLDEAAARASGGRLTRDADGALARAGAVDAGLLERLLADPFFRHPPPRSTGRERFGPALVEALVRERGLTPGAPEGWPDLLATLAALTVQSAARAIRTWVLPRGVQRVVVTGGGAHNPVLVEGLRRSLAPLPVETGASALGLDPDAREAVAFALLAWAFLVGIPGNVPSCTGAVEARVLGSWTPAPGRGPHPPAPPAVPPAGAGGGP
ncbi:MAG: anhydro-N-acetylmuramic acid kinase [Longimicrobiales bacterium]|nr:anhydro-N-acetylmuramic acid kinase [Longimicrobiales bacterium]